MDVMILNRPLKGIQPLFDSQIDMTPEQKDLEMSIILGDTLDDNGRDRELQAHVDRIKILEIELQKARAEAYQAGYDEGQKIAKTEAEKQFTQLTMEFTNNLHSLRSEFSETVEQMADPLLNLSMGVAEKLIEREISKKDAAEEILVTQIQRILNQAATQTRAIVHVNASQLDWITGKNILMSLNVPQKDNLRFIPNPTVKPGECKLETEEYLVDATIKSQLENLAKELNKA